MKAMLWHGTGGLDAYLDSEPFAALCARVIRRKRRNDLLLTVLDPLFRQFLPELIRTAATTHALGQFWRVMSDLFIDLAAAERSGRVDTVAAVVEFLKDGLVAAAAQPITYAVMIGEERFWLLPPRPASPSWSMWLFPTWKPCFCGACPSWHGQLQRPGPADLAGPGPIRLRRPVCRSPAHHGGRHPPAC
jgi:hypothetical protein